ncbi:helix-turn-helix domain-containing protein [Xanthomonadaceae bacterium JHOS43]|jgi:ArsR family transcriptional regulator|nr:helix-turn-helix domain-containing protein [Xanthomonadaceae bacterium JHOS43]MCX7562878.1 helix-turn-helix domain-containing protein [Xanthomonadaceae bacterium XH05]
MKESDAIQSLAALAQSVRLRVFRALVVAGPAGLTPGALSGQLGVSATSLSFHLKELMRSGLVSQERDGRYLIYRASFVQMTGLLDYLTQHCCQGQPCSVTDSSVPGRRAGSAHTQSQS